VSKKSKADKQKRNKLTLPKNGKSADFFTENQGISQKLLILPFL
jgi:hypothetical protein